MGEEEATSSGPATVTRLPLRAMGLRTGMALQTRRLVEGTSKKESQFYGAIEGKGVMVGPLGTQGVETGLTEGEICVVRGFTGQYEFSFISKVLQTFEKPFVYALLAYPAQVDARLVRQSMRTKTSWPCTVVLPHAEAGAQAQAQDVLLVDLSMSGAMVRASSGLGTVGDLITVTLTVTFDGAEVQLLLGATICHNNRAADGAFYIGLAFKDLKQHDKLVLHFATQAPQNDGAVPA
jgi:hypothetical protein